MNFSMTITASTTSVSPSTSNDSSIPHNNESSQLETNNEPKSIKNEKNSISSNDDSSPSSNIIVNNSESNQIKSNNNSSCNINNSANNIDPERRYRPQKYCAVCGDKAIACNFNAVTCESCKAFFRRNAFKETRLKCLFENRCIIDRVTRRFCSKCRLLKCFQIGMKREWILTDEQKQIKRVKIMQNKQSRSQKASTSPSYSEESVSPKLAASTNNFRISSPHVGASDLATTTTTIDNATSTTDTAQSPTRSHQNGSSNSEDNIFLELAKNARSQVIDSNEKATKLNPRNIRGKQSKGMPFVVETRDASTSCPDEFDLFNPQPRSPQHCSFVSQCHYCSLRLFGTPDTTVPTTGGQQMFVDYHQHFHHQLNHHNQQLLMQHPLNGSQESHRIPPHYVASIPPPLPPSNDQLDHSIQSSYETPTSHQVSLNQDLMIDTIASATVAAVPTTTPAPGAATGCCTCNLDPNNLHQIETHFNHHLNNNSQTVQPVPSSDGHQTTNSQQTSPQLHLMTPPHHVSNRVTIGVSDNTPASDCGKDNFILWNNEFYVQPALTEAELKSRLEKLEFLDSEKQVIYETIEATKFIFEHNENHRLSDMLNDIVIFCDAALRRLIKTVKQIKAFRMLNMDDQIILLKTACFRILLLRSTYHFSDELEGWIDHKTGEIMTLDILKRAKKSLVYEKHRDLVKKMPEPLRKDRFVMSIMAMTLLFDPTTSLKHANSVALDNLIYLNLLRKYLICTQPDPLNKYETLVTVLQVIKACNEEYNVFFSKDFHPEQITPLLVEIFDISTVQYDS